MPAPVRTNRGGLAASPATGASAWMSATQRQFDSNRGTNPSAIAPSISVMTTNTAPQEFKIKLSGTELDDLQRRLDATRWPDPAPDTSADFSHGVPLPYLMELTDYWRNDYDWRAQEARLNEIPQ